MEAATAGSESPEKTKAARQKEALVTASEGKASSMEPQAHQDALDWFLSADESEVEHTIRLNVGGPVDEDGLIVNAEKPPVWIDWVVRPLDLDTIRNVRKQSVSAASRRARRGAAGAGGQGEFDDTLFNLGVVVEATVHPDVREAANKQGVADPRIALKQRFAQKSGLIGQIVGEVLDLSGYNENDVQDADRSVSAAGNSSG